jgi:ABC-type polysaccharide/polyol phosphate transport system ATPase subunit
MIELDAGFNQEMSAYDNIVLDGILLGRTPSQMRDRVDAMSGWAELTNFIDVPIRSYSSGTMARLGFCGGHRHRAQRPGGRRGPGCG